MIASWGRWLFCVMLGLGGFGAHGYAQVLPEVKDEIPIAASSAVVIGVTSSSPPFAWVDTQGSLQGFNVELARVLCENLGGACSIEPLPFADVLDGVAKGRLTAGIANALKTPEREAQLLFSKPIWRSTSSFVGRADLPRYPVQSLRKEFSICAVTKTRQEAFVEKLEGPKEHVKIFQRHSDMQAALKEGSCQLMLLPTVNALSFLNDDTGAAFDYYGPPVDSPSLSGAVHIVISPSRPEMVEKIDAIMDKIGRDGTYRALILRFFPFDIL